MRISPFGIALTMLLCLSRSTGSSSSAEIPIIDFHELKDLVDADGDLSSLQDEGGRFGALVVTGLGDKVSTSVASILSKAPTCIGTDKKLPRVVLGDGSSRRTFATADAASFPECLSDQMSTVAVAFDRLEGVIVRMLERVAGRELVYSVGEEADGVQLEESPHKDHLHVYRKKLKPSSFSAQFRHADSFKIDEKQEEKDYLVPFHVDNGLFLLITHFPEHPLQIMLSSGRNATANSDLGSVLVLVGRGLTDWMLQGQDAIRDMFFSVPHAVPSMNLGKLSYRTVYARMKVVPGKAKPAIPEGSNLSGDSLKEFHEVFMLRGKQGWEDSQVCSADLGHHHEDDDHFVRAMDSTCEKGEAYCWMGCYPLPERCPRVEDAVCFSNVTNVTCSTSPGGKPMDPTCKWECKPEKPVKYKMSDYCNGRMDMLMFGFAASGNKKNPCIVLFVEAWTLDSRIKFAIGCVGVMILGFSIEALIALRRNLLRKKRLFVNVGGGARKALALMLFATNLVLGYLAMLVAMTYSVELFFCVVLGLVLGHAVFNADSAVADNIDPCCASQNDVCKRKKRETTYATGTEETAADGSYRDTLLLANTNSTMQSPVSNGSCCSERPRTDSSFVSPCSANVPSISEVKT